jgi:hypothetical protein
MKKLFLFVSLVICHIFLANSQSLSPTALVTTGGYFTGGGNSLSWTMGETFNTTLTNGNLVLTQGEQQPYIRVVLLNMKAFIEGYYLGAGLMTPCLYNNYQASLILNYPFPVFTATDCDTISVSAMSSLDYTPVQVQKGILKTDGTVSVTFRSPVLIGSSYYIRITHRNALETWSAAPVFFNELTTYDFSTSLSQAFSLGGGLDPMHQMIDGPWAIMSGDMSDGVTSGLQDGNIDLLDFPEWDNGNTNFSLGYLPADLNGDVNVDLLDFPFWNANNSLFAYTQHP